MAFLIFEDPTEFYIEVSRIYKDRGNIVSREDIPIVDSAGSDYGTASGEISISLETAEEEAQTQIKKYRLSLKPFGLKAS